MSTPTPFNVTSPADILSYVPHVLGFQPKDSLVFLTMTGKRIGATLRLDLPGPDTDLFDYASGAGSFLQSDTGADGVLMVLYTDQEWTDPAEPPYLELVHCLDLVLDASGLQLRDGWLVGGSHWREYFCDDGSCCPWPGHPRGTITDSRLNAEMVYQGSSYADSLETAVGNLSQESHEDIKRLCGDYQAAYSAGWGSKGLGREALRVWDVVISATKGKPAASPTDTPEVTAFLLAGLAATPIRDCLPVLAALGLDAALSGAAASGAFRGKKTHVAIPAECTAMLSSRPAAADAGPQTSSADAASAFGGVFVGTYAGALDWERLDALHAVLLALSPLASGSSRAALLTILAWIEWARGRGSRAHLYLQESVRVAPGYALARLLTELIGSGALASWTRQRDRAWQSESPHAA
ncbi:DUF4192 domain-containing protein [Arthrobacter sp. H5]|uniref:DUF4192 domain-containing protein n=1 Tax=Arthrobacter sp. H5 TaxID=1267973 RepID=UPI000480D23E|nr:DUF4192 domain-containing protein [Arthrobacter sp. H5]